MSRARAFCPEALIFEEWLAEARKHGGLAYIGSWSEYLARRLEEKRREAEAEKALLERDAEAERAAIQAEDDAA